MDTEPETDILKCSRCLEPGFPSSGWLVFKMSYRGTSIAWYTTWCPCCVVSVQDEQEHYARLWQST